MSNSLENIAPEEAERRHAETQRKLEYEKLISQVVSQVTGLIKNLTEKKGWSDNQRADLHDYIADVIRDNARMLRSDDLPPGTGKNTRH